MISLLVVCAAFSTRAAGAVSIHRDAGEVPTSASSYDRVAKAADGEQKLYSCGSPTNDEQYTLELINRARATPSKEIARIMAVGDTNIQKSIDYFGVDMTAVQSDFSGYSVQPPLALNALLSTAAKRHAVDLRDNDFQEHVGSDGSTVADRLTDAGYPWIRGGENIYSYAKSILHGHAGFLVDWGVPDLGHRNNLMNLGSYSGYREVGLSVLTENNDATDVGPYVIVQDFGTDNTTRAFIVGVVYRDRDGNKMYSPGEGLGSVEIRPDRGEWYARTSSSGGYAIPVDDPTGQFVLTATRSDLDEQTIRVSMDGANVKADFVYTVTQTPPSDDTTDNIDDDGASGDSGGSASNLCTMAGVASTMMTIVAMSLLAGPGADRRSRSTRRI